MLVCLWGFSDCSYVCTIYPYFPLKCSHSIINSPTLHNMRLISFSPVFSHKQYFNNETYLYYFCWMPCIMTLIIVDLSMLFIILTFHLISCFLSFPWWTGFWSMTSLSLIIFLYFSLSVSFLWLLYPASLLSLYTLLTLTCCHWFNHRLYTGDS